MTLKKRAFRTLAVAGARTGLLVPLAQAIEASLEEVAPRSRPAASADAIRLLALNPDRFRGDLQALADTGAVRPFRFPLLWQNRFQQAFHPAGTDFYDYYRPREGSPQARSKAELLRVLTPLMRLLKRRRGVDLVLGAAVHYTQDAAFGEAAEAAGIPYVVFHRESFHASPAAVRGNVERLRRMGRFAGSLLVVHNEAARRTFIEAEFVEPERCLALGAMRMDEFAARLSLPRPKRARPLVSLFSFSHGVGQSGLMSNWSPDGKLGFVRLFEQAHCAIAALARRRPDVDFVIKPKWAGDFQRRVEEALLRGGHAPREIPNLRIDPAVDAQDLIFESDVVSAFNSTTMLEAAVAGKPVVQPMFAEAATDSYADWILLRERQEELFDVARSPEDYERTIEARLEDWSPTPDLMRRRREAFEAWIAPLDRGVADSYVKALDDVLRRRPDAAVRRGRDAPGYRLEEGRTASSP